MSANASEKSEKVSERKFMGLSIAEASSFVRRVAEPRPDGDSVKAAILRASRRLQWTFTRTKDIWYCDPRIRISAAESDQLRAKFSELEVELAKQKDELAIFETKAKQTDDNSAQLLDELKAAHDALTAFFARLPPQRT